MLQIELEENQQKKANSIYYILTNIARADNIHKFIEYFNDIKKCEEFLFFVKSLVYNENYDCDLLDIFEYLNKTDPKYTIIINISNLTKEIKRCMQLFDNSDDQSYLCSIMLNKQIISDQELRIFYSSILVKYFENLLLSQDNLKYYNYLQSRVNILAINI